MTTDEPTMTSNQVARSAGVSYRQIDYWCRCGLIDGTTNPGSGGRRAFTAAQVRRVHELAAAARLRSTPIGVLADMIADDEPLPA